MLCIEIKQNGDFQWLQINRVCYVYNIEQHYIFSQFMNVYVFVFSIVRSIVGLILCKILVPLKFTQFFVVCATVMYD